MLLEKNAVIGPLITELVASFCGMDDEFKSAVDKFFLGENILITYLIVLPYSFL